MEKDYSNILINNEPDDVLFLLLTERIKCEFNAEIIERIDGLDERYWDFKINDCLVTLHQQHYLGISIFPTNLEDATEAENNLVEKVGIQLKYSTAAFETWIKITDNSETEINSALEIIQKTRSDRTEYKLDSYSDYAECEGYELCYICSRTISCDGPEYNIYSTLMHIVCPDCFNKYVSNDNYLAKIETLEKFRKQPQNKQILKIDFLSKLKAWLNKCVPKI